MKFSDGMKTKRAIMSTSDPSVTLDQALSSLPSALRSRVVKSYTDLKTRALEGQFDAVGVRAGRLAEVLLRVLQHLLDGSYVPFTTQLRGNARELRSYQSHRAQRAYGFSYHAPSVSFTRCAINGTSVTLVVRSTRTRSMQAQQRV